MRCGKVWSRWRPLMRALPCALLSTSLAAARSAAEVPQLHAGAIEVGLSVSIISVEGAQLAVLNGRAGRFWSAGRGLLGLELEAGYLHRLGLDGVDIGAQVTWQPRLEERPYHPYVGAGLALRQEYLGSFHQSRFPVGVDVGLRAMIAPSALVRTELRARRILGDPVADFTEVAFLVGVSLVLRNR